MLINIFATLGPDRDQPILFPDDPTEALSEAEPWSSTPHLLTRPLVRLADASPLSSQNNGLYLLSLPEIYASISSLSRMHDHWKGNRSAYLTLHDVLVTLQQMEYILSSEASHLQQLL